MKRLLSILLCVLLSLSSLPITVMAEESQTVNVYDAETFGKMPASDDKPEETTTENTTSDPTTDNTVSSFVATSDNNPTHRLRRSRFIRQRLGFQLGFPHRRARRYRLCSRSPHHYEEKISRKIGK